MFMDSVPTGRWDGVLTIFETSEQYPLSLVISGSAGGEITGVWRLEDERESRTVSGVLSGPAIRLNTGHSEGYFEGIVADVGGKKVMAGLVVTGKGIGVAGLTFSGEPDFTRGWDEVSS